MTSIIVDPISIDMNKKNSQCDDVSGIEAIEFIHKYSSPGMRSEHINKVHYIQGFRK